MECLGRKSALKRKQRQGSGAPAAANMSRSIPFITWMMEAVNFVLSEDILMIPSPTVSVALAGQFAPSG